MKQKTRVLTLLTAMALLAGGCTKNSGNSSRSGAVTSPAGGTTAITELTTFTEATISPDVDRTPAVTDTAHISDRAGVLTPEDLQALSERATWLSDTFRIAVQVVITDDLEGQAPADYAAQCDAALCGEMRNGALLLLDNAGGTDYFFTKGSCRLYLPDAGELICARISKDLAAGNYRAAVEYVFAQLELACPKHIFDLPAALDAEASMALERAGEAAAESLGAEVSVVMTLSPATNEAAERFRQGLYGDADSILLLLDTKGNTLAAAMGGSLREEVSNTTLGGLLDRVDAALQDDSPQAAARRFYTAAETLR